MAFTGTIDPLSPVGTDPVSQGDSQFRNLKLAVVERMQSMAEDMDVDPIVLQQKALDAIALLKAVRYNGSLDTPTPGLSGEESSGLASYGYGDTDNVMLARIIGVARELLSDSAAGGLWRVSATKVGTRTLVDLFDIQVDANDDAEIVAESGLRFSSKDASPIDFDGILTENDRRVVTTQFDTDDGQPELYDVGSVGSLPTINWNNGPVQKVTLTTNTTILFSNPVVGGTYMLIVEQDSAGGHDPTLSGWDFGTAGTAFWPVAPNARALVSALYDGTRYIAGVGHISA